MLKKLLMVIGVCFVVFLAGCKGDDGAVGPAGPAGPTGATGAAGVDGAGSSAAIISTGAQTSTEGGGFSIGLDSLTADESEAYNSVVVMVYIKAQGVWWPLPGVVSFGNSAVSDFTFVHGVDGSSFFVDILTTNWSENQDTAPTRNFEDIRIILVPGSLLKLSADVNWKNYDEAVKALGLSDTIAKQASLLKRK